MNDYMITLMISEIESLKLRGIGKAEAFLLLIDALNSVSGLTPEVYSTSAEYFERASLFVYGR